MSKAWMAGLLTAAWVTGVSYAGAVTIDYTDLTPGATGGTGPGWSAAALGGTFGWKTVNGYTAAGIMGGRSGNEIDLVTLGSGEGLRFVFDAPTVVDDFTLAFLYSQGPFLDVYEKAGVYVDGDALYTLTVTGPTTAVWSGGATVQNLSSAGTTTAAAVWTVSGKPFGDAAVTSLRFVALDNFDRNAPAFTNNSDYAFSSLNGTPVPEPGTMLLLGTGLVSLAGWGRRRRGT